MKTIVSTLILTLAACGLSAQPQLKEGPWNDPATPNQGRAPYRSEFISYDIREAAEKGDPAANRYYKPLELNRQTAGGVEIMSSAIDVPYMWLDRELFLRVEGIAAFAVTVNGCMAGYGEDSHVASEFNISPYVTDGHNEIAILPVAGTGARLETPYAATAPRAYIFSQPKIRIEDYTIRFEPDSTGTHGIFDLEVVMANSYNSDEEISVGFDVYSPQKLEHFDIRPFKVRGNGRDTLRISQQIWRTPANAWSESKPGLYHGMLIVKRGNRFVEYILYKVGFGTTEYRDGRIYRNGTPITIKAVRYNNAGDRKTTRSQLSTLKKQGFNTVYPDCPQPIWVYDLCDELGLYVIEQANIDAGCNYGSTDPKESPANNPLWLNTFMARTEAMYARVRNHTCVIGWSLGGNVGNGFNMYRTYKRLKQADLTRAVIFNDARGQWNSDMAPIGAAEGKDIVNKGAILKK